MPITARVATTGLGLALLLSVLPYGASASPDRSTLDNAPTRTVVPTKLKRGPDATIDFMQDGIIHFGGAGGWRIGIRTPTNRNQRQLLGISRKGWLVAVRKGNTSRVIAVRRGRKPVTVPGTRNTTYGQGDSAIGWRLSHDGEMLVSTLYDRGGSTTYLQNLAGKGRGSYYSSDYFTPLDADTGHVVTYRENKFNRLRVYDWVPKVSATELVKDASYASLRDDVIFSHTTGRLYGPTAISAPETPAWAAAFQPLSISPNGRTAIGLRIPKSIFDSPAILDVRRMSDGALLDSIAYGPRITTDDWELGKTHEQTARWENNRRYVFQLATRRGAVLVRCRLNGPCKRASNYGGDITTSFETFMWW